MGNLDRLIRILVAIIINVLYLTNLISGTLGIVFLIFAVVFVLTSFLSFCPLYIPLGINTCKK
jgi:hypothetical protein